MPGTSSERSWNFRPLSGMFSTIFCVITWPTSEVVDWTSGVSPITSTVSVTAPTFIEKSTFAVSPIRTSTPFVTWVLKPLSDTLTS